MGHLPSDVPSPMQNAMRHLDPERLAALDHDPPIADDAAHLALCAACRDEAAAYDAMRTDAVQLRHAGDGASAPDRLVSWDSLAAALRAEGLISTPLAPSPVTPLETPSATPFATPATLTTTPAHVARPAIARAPSRMRVAPLLRAAAVVAAMVGSAALGRLSATRTSSPDDPATAIAAATTGTPQAPAATGNLDALTSLASYSAGGFTSVSDATAALTRAQQEYERAAVWLASNDTTPRSSEIYRARLAALDQMIAASRAALRAAPQDPVLNHYYLATYAAREATLQQLSGALPVDQTIESY